MNTLFLNLLVAVLGLSSFVLNYAHSEDAEIKCTEITPDKFSLKVTTGGYDNKINYEYENFRNDERIKLAYVPTGSIVKIGDEISFDKNKLDKYYQVEIQSVGKSNDTLENGFSFLNRPDKKTPKVKSGQKGYLWGESLKPITDYRFVVTNPALLLELTKLDLDGKPIEFVKQIKCCKISAPTDCDHSSVFKIVGTKQEFQIDNCKECNNPLESLRPVPKKDVSAIINIVEAGKIKPQNFEMVTSRGLIELPFDKQTQNAPFCSWHYNPDAPDGIDAYTYPLTGCIFLETLRQHSSNFLKTCLQKSKLDECCTEFRNSGMGVQWGDIGHAYYKEKGQGDWPHHTHTGKCIDIRPLKSQNASSKFTGVRWDDKSRFSEERTRDFIKLLIKNGADAIFFNDPKLIKEGLTRRLGGHDDHVHFCFDPDKLQDSKIPEIQKCLSN